MSWQSQAAPATGGAVQVALQVNGQPLSTAHSGQYRVQYVMADVQDFVIGLFNADTGTEWGSLGDEYYGSPLSTTSISFGALSGCTAAGDTGTVPIFLGTMSGCNANGLIGKNNGLTLAQFRTANRWLLVRKNAALDSLTKATTFSNLTPDTHYVLFAEAFLKNVPDATDATESDVAGVATASVTVTANSTTNASLALNLNFNEGSVSATVNATAATPSATAI